MHGGKDVGDLYFWGRVRRPDSPSGAAIRIRGRSSPYELNQLDDVFPLLPGVLAKGKAMNGFIIVDSIQTMVTREIGTTPGTLNQIQGVHATTHYSGQIHWYRYLSSWGILPRMAWSLALRSWKLWWMWFCISRGSNRPYRPLRTIKNRFGATHEVGVFDMKSGGWKRWKIHRCSS